MLCGCLFAISGACGQPAPSSAPTDSLSVQGLYLGCGGLAKTGTWTPLVVDVRAEHDTREVRLVVFTQDSQGVRCAFESSPPEPIPAGEIKRFTSWIRVGRMKTHVDVQVWEGDELRTTARWTPTQESRILPPSTHCVLALGGELPWNRMLQLRGSSPAGRLVIARAEEPALLPDDHLGYDGIDTLMISTGDVEFLQQLRLEQWAAVRDYVRYGGRVIVSLSGQAQGLWDAQPALRELIPAEIQGVMTQKETTGLEIFSGSDQRLDVQARRQNEEWPGVPAIQYGTLRAKTLAFDGNRARRTHWVVQANLGLGLVTLVAADWTAEPLLSWPGLPRLMDQTLRVTFPEEDDSRPADGDRPMSHVGYVDLAGQVRMALDQFHGIPLVSLSSVVFLVGLYVALVGLGDYFLWRWWGARGSGPWWTFLGCVALASGIGYAIAYQNRGTSLRANRIEIVDIDAATSSVRGFADLRLYSPAAERFRLTADPPREILRLRGPERVLLSWQGLPGSGLGGMDSTVSVEHLFEPYRHRWSTTEYGSALGVADLALPAGASWGFSLDWTGNTEQLDVTPLKADSLGLLSGEMINPLPVDLRDCGVCYGRWYFPLGEMSAGARVILDRSQEIRDLAAHLMRRRMLKDKEVTAPWSILDRDLKRIAEMLMFHKAARGENYTGLRHEYLRRLDYTDQLGLQSAILVGRTDQPLTNWDITSASLRGIDWGKQMTFVRILIPVISGDSSRAGTLSSE